MSASEVVTVDARFMDSGEPADLDDLLHSDAVFHSPAVHTLQTGRSKVATYLLAAERMFSGSKFRYTDSWYRDRSAVLEFEVELDGKHIEGIDMIRWNDEDRITSVKVMIRPFRGLQTVIPIMGALLPHHRGDSDV